MGDQGRGEKVNKVEIEQVKGRILFLGGGSVGVNRVKTLPGSTVGHSTLRG